MAWVGRTTSSVAVAIARRASKAYLAIDPDLRRHLADLPLIATTLIGPRQPALVARRDDGHRPLVCIHGLSGHQQNFLPLRGLLALHGRTRVYSLGFDDDAPLEDAARALVDFAERVCALNELGAEAKIDVLAHSMGGVVARLALLDVAFAARVEKLVTVATPHHGTHSARFLATRPVVDLRPGSALLERLAGQDPWPGPPELPTLVSFYSQADVLMLPAKTPVMEGADNREIPGVSHSGFLIWPRALTRLQEALAD